MTELAPSTPHAVLDSRAPASKPGVAEVHRVHGTFIRKTLHRLGGRPPHLEDLYQEVFLVVHRRLDSFGGQCSIRTWLFEVCYRVTAGYRRRAHFHRERPMADVGDVGFASPTPTPDREFERQEDARRVHRALDKLTSEQRAVLTLFELEGMSCEQISLMMDAPIGTTYSRLFRARQAFQRAVSRHRLREK